MNPSHVRRTTTIGFVEYPSSNSSWSCGGRAAIEPVNDYLGRRRLHDQSRCLSSSTERNDISRIAHYQSAQADIDARIASRSDIRSSTSQNCVGSFVNASGAPTDSHRTLSAWIAAEWTHCQDRTESGESVINANNDACIARRRRVTFRDESAQGVGDANGRARSPNHRTDNCSCVGDYELFGV